ncbi:hypothetical protein ACFLS1_02300 [Verrucomicrobiota bacterium]
MNTKNNIFLTAVFLVFIQTAMFSSAPGADEGTSFINKEPAVQWLSGYHSDSSLRFFFNRESGLEEDRFGSEADIRLQYIILSWQERLRLCFDVRLISVMGESIADNMPFSPMELSYHATPFIEYVRPGIIYRIGWNHACDHLVYKDNPDPWYQDEELNDMEPDIYYNRFFVAAGSPTIRRIVHRENICRDNNNKWGMGRFVWYAEAANYIRSIGSMSDSDFLYGGNDWRWDFILKLRYPLFVGKSFALLANNRTVLLLDGDDETYWRDLLELELMLTGGRCGMSFFAGINLLDEHPYDSREGLGEVGFRFFF